MFQSGGTQLLYLASGATTTMEMSSLTDTQAAAAVSGADATGRFNVQGGPSSGNSVAAGSICASSLCVAVAMPSETQTGLCAGIQPQSLSSRLTASLRLSWFQIRLAHQLGHSQPLTLQQPLQFTNSLQWSGRYFRS